MQSIEVGGMIFPVIGRVKRQTGEIVPLIEINMMSDERWQQLAAESAVKHFREWYGRDPESLREAFEGQRAYIEKFWHEEDGKRGADICTIH